MRQAFKGCASLATATYQFRTVIRTGVGFGYRTGSKTDNGWWFGRTIHRSVVPNVRPYLSSRSTVRVAGADERHTSSLTGGWPSRPLGTYLRNRGGA